jgi:hypothetical protein
MRFPVLVSDLVFAMRSTWWNAGYPHVGELAGHYGVPNDWAFDLRPLRAVHSAVGVAALLVGGWVAWSAQKSRPSLRFVALALPLALIPALGSMPESRLLLPALLGWSVLLAQFCASLLARWRDRHTVRAAGALCAAAALAALEAIASLNYSLDEAADLPRLAHAVRESIVARELDGLLSNAKRVLLISAVDPTTTIYIPLVRRWHGRPGPDACQLLFSAFAPMRLERLSLRGFILERLTDYLTPPDIYAQAFNRAPLQSGQHFESDGLRVEVERVADGLPMRIRYELDISLDDPSTVLLTQTTRGLYPMLFPPIGEGIVIPPAFPPIERIYQHAP